LQYRGELILLEDHGNVLGETKPNNTAVELSDLKIKVSDSLSESTTTGGESSGAMVTVMICLRPETSTPQRFGIVVRRVLDVSAGRLLAENSELGTSQLAMIENRVTTVCIPTAARTVSELVTLQEVA
jgi:hypothetical protein